MAATEAAYFIAVVRTARSRAMIAIATLQGSAALPTLPVYFTSLAKRLHIPPRFFLHCRRRHFISTAALYYFTHCSTRISHVYLLPVSCLDMMPFANITSPAPTTPITPRPLLLLSQMLAYFMITTITLSLFSPDSHRLIAHCLLFTSPIDSCKRRPPTR